MIMLKMIEVLGMMTMLKMIEVLGMMTMLKMIEVLGMMTMLKMMRMARIIRIMRKYTLYYRRFYWIVMSLRMPITIKEISPHLLL